MCLQPLRLLPPYVGAGWDGGGARPDPHLRREHATPVPSFGASLLGPHTAWGSLWKEASSAVRVPSHFAPNVGTVQHAVAVGNGLQSWLARARRLLYKTWSSVTAFMLLFRVACICSEALAPPPQFRPLNKHGRATAPMPGRGALGDAILHVGHVHNPHYIVVGPRAAFISFGPRAGVQSGRGPRLYIRRAKGHIPYSCGRLPWGSCRLYNCARSFAFYRVEVSPFGQYP